MTPPPVSSKVSSCAACAMPIIGGRSCCPACLERREVPRDLGTRRPSIWHGLVAWFFVVELLVIVILLILIAGKGCT